MNTRMLGLALCLVAVGRADIAAGPSLFGLNVTRSVVITLGPAPMTIEPFVPEGPHAPALIVAGTHVRLAAGVGDYADPVVTWYKDDQTLTNPTSILDIPQASAADNGTYWAIVSPPASNPSGRSYATSRATLLVTTKATQRLLNLSSRARIGATNPALLVGFVIEPGPAQTLVLIRAIGPSLRQFGVSDALAATKIRLLNSSGNEITLNGPGLSSPTWYASQVGAFPLAAGTHDAEGVVLLRAGVYTAELTSADAGAGTALLEVYEIPLPAYGG